MAKDTKERILMAALDMFSKKGYIRSFMHYRMELRLTMEIAVQKCLMQHVRMKEGFVFMEKWQISRFQLRELELNYAGGEKKW